MKTKKITQNPKVEKDIVSPKKEEKKTKKKKKKKKVEPKKISIRKILWQNQKSLKSMKKKINLNLYWKIFS